MSLRLEIPGHTLHLIQRGYLQGAVFFSTQDRLSYLGLLGEWARRSECALHAYVLMANHVHLLLTPMRPGSAQWLMREINQRYARYLRNRIEWEGTLWEPVYRAMPAAPNRYALACMRYIELNPVRARMAACPEGFRWSSHRYHALGEENTLLTPHSAYAALGRGALSRQMAYRAMFNLRPGARGA
jgi:putative transposase